MTTTLTPTRTTDLSDEVTTMHATVAPHIADATVTKFEAINARAEAKGLAGRWEVAVSAPREVARPVFPDRPGGPTYFVTVVDVTVTGQAPSFQGWTFAATIADLDGHIILRSFEGAPRVDRDALVVGECGHCRTRRRRSDTYVFVHEDGRQIQVGSTCLKDFAGWSGLLTFERPQGRDEDDWLGAGEGRGREQWPLGQVLELAIRATHALGFVPTSSEDRTPTREVVTALLTGSPTTTAAKYRSELADVQPDMTAADVTSYISDVDAAGIGDYMANLRAVIAAGIVSARELGLVCSAPNVLNRHRREQAEQALKAPVQNEVYAAPGTKFTGVPVEVVYVSTERSRYRYGGLDTFAVMVTESGHRLSWSTGSPAFTPRRGDRYVIAGTVKDTRTDGQGRMTTRVLRVKATPAPATPDA